MAFHLAPHYVEKGGEEQMEAILSDYLVLESGASLSILALLVLAVGALLTRNRRLPEDTPLFAPP
jgi:hypothetical protein